MFSYCDGADKVCKLLNCLVWSFLGGPVPVYWVWASQITFGSHVCLKGIALVLFNTLHVSIYCCLRTCKVLSLVVFVIFLSEIIKWSVFKTEPCKNYRRVSAASRPDDGYEFQFYLFMILATVKFIFLVSSLLTNFNYLFMNLTLAHCFHVPHQSLLY